MVKLMSDDTYAVLYSGADKFNSISEMLTCWNDKAGTTV